MSNSLRRLRIFTIILAVPKPRRPFVRRPSPLLHSSAEECTLAQVLIIEDELGIAESLAYLLRQESFEVRQAARLAEGREAAPRADLIVLDLTLPDGSGLEFLRHLRTGAKTPVIILTSRDTEVDRVVGLELGADDYVVKPFSPREVVARVKAVLRRTTPEAEPAAATHDGHPIQIDEDRRL